MDIKILKLGTVASVYSFESVEEQTNTLFQTLNIYNNKLVDPWVLKDCASTSVLSQSEIGVTNWRNFDRLA